MADLGADISLKIALSEIEKKVVQAEVDRDSLKTNLSNKGVNVSGLNKMGELVSKVNNITLNKYLDKKNIPLVMQSQVRREDPLYNLMVARSAVYTMTENEIFSVGYNRTKLVVNKYNFDTKLVTQLSEFTTTTPTTDHAMLCGNCFIDNYTKLLIVVNNLIYAYDIVTNTWILWYTHDHPINSLLYIDDNEILMNDRSNKSYNVGELFSINIITKEKTLLSTFGYNILLYKYKDVIYSVRQSDSGYHDRGTTRNVWAYNMTTKLTSSHEVSILFKDNAIYYNNSNDHTGYHTDTMYFKLSGNTPLFSKQERYDLPESTDCPYKASANTICYSPDGSFFIQKMRNGTYNDNYTLKAGVLMTYDLGYGEL